MAQLCGINPSLKHSVRISTEEEGLHSLGGSSCLGDRSPESAQEFVVALESFLHFLREH
jgi:hypothetical protein